VKSFNIYGISFSAKTPYNGILYFFAKFII